MNRNAALLVLALVLPGCASIVSGTSQPLSVQARHKDGTYVADAKCKLTNDKGVWFVTTPGSVTVHRSYNDLALECTKEKYVTGTTMTKSATKGMLAGNMLFGGLIGAGIDAGTGAAYDYPDVISVEMVPAE